ncbi:TonB-dependent receptor domain-containing protein [Moraxella nasicaprae]|uniref:TonB-dependent receptor n=1 Tax=Moraxella nasicaprae TaxID=2904122 RepID=A0ABY6F2T1_9GAMM|nr:TonB-dependent receptor [Moraxella nasicaprae]UXZ04405.1 TonB-dependent receptor [Moraxella nasicaprae]
MKGCKQLPLTAAVLGALFTSAAFAQTTDTQTVDLGTEVIRIDRLGAKVKTNVVTLQEKEESTATDLRELLKDEPAIDFSGGNGTSQYIAIRGMGQNSIDVKVDNAYSDTQILYHQGRHQLDPALVKIVEVQKGAGGASAGIGATNGAIIAKTVDAHDLLKGSDKNYGVKVGAGYSSNKEVSGSISAFGKTDNFDLLISGNYVDQDNYEAGKGVEQITSAADGTREYISPVDGSKTVPYSALEKVSYLAKAGVNLGNHRFVLSHFKTNNKGTRNIREEFNVFDGQDPQYRELSLENTNLEYSAKDLGKFVSAIDANVYLMKNTRESADDAKSGYAGRFAGDNKTSIETKGANINFDSEPVDGVLLKTGVNYRHQEAFPNKLEAGLVNQEKTDLGVYAEAIGEVGNFTLTTGVRYDHFKITAMDGKEVSGSSVSPSVGVIWEPVAGLSFNAVHNHATRSPRLYDALTAHGRRAVVSVADNATAERAKNTEIGFNYNKGGFSLNGSYFWQRIDNLLNSAPNGRHAELNVNQNLIGNVGHAKNKGYEINAAYRANGVTVRAGVAESKPEYYSDRPFNNREYGNRIGRTYTAGLAYRFAPVNLEVGANYRRVDKVTGESAWMEHKVSNPRARGDNDLNLVKYGYDVVDLYANYKPLNNDKLNINLAVNNVADKYYIPHTATSGLPAAGREYRVGVNFTY